MLTLVFGGSASGKSAYGESLAVAIPGEKIYLATMESVSDAAKARIQKHRAMRAGKGFTTIECGRVAEFGNLDVDNCVVLLEDLGNLVANELFAPDAKPVEQIAASIRAGLDALEAKAKEVIVITGDLASDGMDYDAITMEYVKLLGQLQVYLGQKSHAAWEVVAGCAISLKEQNV